METISPLELVDHYLARIERWDAALGAYVTVTADLARDQARAAERVVAEAARSDDWSRSGRCTGCLCRSRTSTSSRGCAAAWAPVIYDLLPELDDNVVGRLRAGGVSLPRQDQHPGVRPALLHRARRGATGTYAVGPRAVGRRVERRGRRGGGRRAGAGRAGLGRRRLDPDPGQRLRARRAEDLARPDQQRARSRTDRAQLGVNGPLARTVADAAALLDVMAGRSPDDRTPAPQPPPARRFPCCRRPPSRVDCGSAAMPTRSSPTPSSTRSASRPGSTASALLTELGHVVEDVPRPFGPDAVGHFENIWAGGAAMVPVLPQPTRSGSARSPAGCGSGAVPSARASWLASEAYVVVLSQAAIAATAAYDAVLTPTLAQLPALVGGLRDDADPAGGLRGAETLHALHGDLQRHRPARPDAPAVLDRRGAPGRGAAGRSSRRRGDAALARGAAGAGRPVGPPPPGLLVTRDRGVLRRPGRRTARAGRRPTR